VPNGLGPAQARWHTKPVQHRTGMGKLQGTRRQRSCRKRKPPGTGAAVEGTHCVGCTYRAGSGRDRPWKSAAGDGCVTVARLVRLMKCRPRHGGWNARRRGH